MESAAPPFCGRSVWEDGSVECEDDGVLVMWQEPESRTVCFQCALAIASGRLCILGQFGKQLCIFSGGVWFCGCICLPEPCARKLEGRFRITVAEEVIEDFET